jgi:hypothetical protein
MIATLIGTNNSMIFDERTEKFESAWDSVPDKIFQQNPNQVIVHFLFLDFIQADSSEVWPISNEERQMLEL